MSTVDPMQLMLDDAAYDQLLKDAETDKRVGDHDAIVQKVTNDHWPEQYGGHPRQKVDFVLLSANNAKADWTFSPPPPPDVVKAEKDTWEQGKLRAIAGAVAQLRQLVKDYGVTMDADGYLAIKEGDRFKVKTVKTRRDDNTGKGGFVRVVAFLPKDRPVGEKATNAASGGTAPAF